MLALILSALCVVLVRVGASWYGKLAWLEHYLAGHVWEMLFKYEFRKPFHTWQEVAPALPGDAHTLLHGFEDSIAHAFGGATNEYVPSPELYSAAGQLMGVFPLKGDADGTVRIGLAADWGAGTMEADLVQAAMVGTRTVPEWSRDENEDHMLSGSPPLDPQHPHYTIHCGDIYFVGHMDEVRKTFLGEVIDNKYRMGVKWPAGQSRYAGATRQPRVLHGRSRPVRSLATVLLGE